MMDAQLIVVCLLTAAINLIGTLAYGARIAGVRTRRIAMSFALFNILVLVSRTANGFLGPFLANRIEDRLTHGGGAQLEGDFRLVILSASVAVFAGILLVPTAQRIFSTAIGSFRHHRSTARMVLRTATPQGLRLIRRSVSIPVRSNLKDARRLLRQWRWVLLGNMTAQALLTVGVLASLYAGFLNPQFRVTASQMSAIVNGLATILLFALIDPQISILTDDVIDGRVAEPTFRRAIVWISLSRLAGTITAQAIFLPAAWLVAFAANRV